MTDEVKPPEGDEAQDRHRFYAQASSAINSQTQAIERAFGVIKSLEATMKEHNDLLKELKTTGRNMIFLAVFLSGAVGWYVSRVVTHSDEQAKTIEKIDRLVELHDIMLKQQQPITEQLTSIKSRLGRVEDQLEAMERKK